MQPLIVMAGPTACGKTRTAVKLAQLINGEVVSADSMQVYTGMDIGTAKPTIAEREGIPHHLIDVVAPDKPFSAAYYQQLAAAAIRGVHERDRIPILTGGTGFYINAVVYGNQFKEIPGDEAYRAEMYNIAQKKGDVYLHELLTNVDPETAAVVHPNNIKKVVRALSFFYATGETLSRHNAEQRQNKPVYDLLFYMLDMARPRLYERIDTRVSEMLDTGLIEEVRTLRDKGYHAGLVSMQGLGYKETLRYLNGEWTLPQAQEAIQTGTRHYAKRQVTWFTHRSPDAKRISMDGISPDDAAKQIMQSIREAQFHE